MNCYDAAFVAAATAILAWVFNRIANDYQRPVNTVCGYAALAFCVWGGFILVSTVLART